MRLKNKVAIVTGAAGGIGRGIALALSNEGAGIAICDVDKEGLKKTDVLVQESSGEVFTSAFDIRKGDAIQEFVESVYQKFGRIDILVNVAGIMPVADNEDIEESTVDDILAVNLKAPVLFTRHVISPMREAGGGSIIHMASVTGHNGHPGVVVYGATKGGLMALARGQAMELAKENIRVNTVSPGTVDTPMLHRFLEEEAEDKAKARIGFDDIHPRGTVATVEEVALVVVFLASDDAVNITGEDIRCDGGYCIQGFQPKE